jgi:hypothetical protein
VAALAENTSAQQEFRALSSAWHSQGSRERAALELQLRTFVERYPDQDPTRLAKAYLAWVLYQKGELVVAERWIEPNLRGPEGRAKDFSQVVEAALMTEHGRPFDALKQLRPLQGKIIDPVERFLATEQLVKSALAANLYAEALGYMVDWIDQAPERDRTAILQTIESHIGRIPENYLERSLDELEAEQDESNTATSSGRVSHRHWLFQTLTRHLAAVALRTKDVDLAARIIERNPALALDPNSGPLVQLATGGEPPATIAGHTIGLLIETEAPLARRRAASVAAGIAFALAQPAGKQAGVRLVFEQATGDTGLALSKLSAEGAALIVAGVDAPSSDGAARYAQVTHAPVLLLSAAETHSPFAFTLGVEAAEQEKLLSSFLVNQGARTLTFGPLAQTCRHADTPPPVQEWQTQQVSGVVILTDETCASEVLRTARSLHFAPRVAFGLEAARTQFERTTSDTLLWLTAGHFPSSDNEPESLVAFRQRAGRDPNWYEVLGRDAAQIAIEVLSALPELMSTEPSAVADYHSQVRERVQKFRSKELWSAFDARFDVAGQLTRELSIVDKVNTR